MSGPAWLYLQSERGESPLWTVGFYAPDGSWTPSSDHSDEEEAARRVHYLNGGSPGYLALYLACKRAIPYLQDHVASTAAHPFDGDGGGVGDRLALDACEDAIQKAERGAS